MGAHNSDACSVHTFIRNAEAVGIAFPVLASVICAGDVETELPGHFQSFLMNPGKREGAFLAK